MLVLWLENSSWAIVLKLSGKVGDKVMSNLKFREGDIIRDKFGNEYEIGHIF